MSGPTEVPELYTPRLRLRWLEETDAEAMHAAYGDAVAMRFWDSLPSRDIAETAARIRQSRAADPQYHVAFAVLQRDTGRFVGMVNYHLRQPSHRRMAWGWIIAPAWQRQGIADEATRALLKHCFTVFDTHRVEAQIEPANIASTRLAERLGFRHEGLMRDWLFVADQPRTVGLYALLRSEWDGGHG